MKRIRFLRQKEVDIKLRHEWAERPRKLVPWWARALRRIGMRHGLRQQTTGSLSGARSARVRVPEPPRYTRRSVVKASFSRDARKGAWTAHAKYLSRPGAQQEIAKGLGFDSSREGIDRMRSQEIATRELGPRLEPEMLHARERVVRREQWTEIDRALQHKADANRIVSYEHFQPRSDGARIRAEQEIDRLNYLTGLGLARRIDEHSWQLSETHERELRDRQQSNDVIKTRARERQRAVTRGQGFEHEMDRDG